MAKGGRRPGAGRPRKKPLPKVRPDVALEVLEAYNADTAKEKCSKEVQKWLTLVEAADQRLQFDVIRYLKECVDGKPKQRTEETHFFDPNAPLHVIVEHIGRPQDKAAAKAK